VLLLTSLDNQNLLRGLEIFVVLLVWLFFFRVIRAVWVEVRPPRARAGAVELVRAPPSASRRDRGLRLRVAEPETQRGTIYDVPTEVTVGRAAGCGVRIDDQFTSNLHARLTRRDGALWVEDLGSTNGTWINSEKVVTLTRLAKGDVLQIGGTVFEVIR
jgi:hypothetical protein